MIIISEIFVVIGISIFLFIFQPVSTLICLILMISMFIFQFFREKSRLYGEGRFNSEEKMKFIKDIFWFNKGYQNKKKKFFLKI